MMALRTFLHLDNNYGHQLSTHAINSNRNLNTNINTTSLPLQHNKTPLQYSSKIKFTSVFTENVKNVYTHICASGSRSIP